MQTESIPRKRLSMPRRVVAAAAPAVEEVVESTPAATAMAYINSMSLLRERRYVKIEHNGSIYKLQVTKLGKLILTK